MLKRKLHLLYERIPVIMQTPAKLRNTEKNYSQPPEKRSGTYREAAKKEELAIIATHPFELTFLHQINENNNKISQRETVSCSILKVTHIVCWKSLDARQLSETHTHNCEGIDWPFYVMLRVIFLQVLIDVLHHERIEIGEHWKIFFIDTERYGEVHYSLSSRMSDLFIQCMHRLIRRWKKNHKVHKHAETTVCDVFALYCIFKHFNWYSSDNFTRKCFSPSRNINERHFIKNKFLINVLNENV